MSLLSLLSSQDLASLPLTALVLFVLGALYSHVRPLVRSAALMLAQRFTVHVEIRQKESPDAYDWLIKWMGDDGGRHLHSTQKYCILVDKQVAASGKARRRMEQHGSSDTAVLRKPPKISFGPGGGMSVVMWEGRYVWVTRTVKDTITMEGVTTNESISLFSWSGNREAIQRLVEEAMRFSLDQDKGNTVIYTVDRSYGGSWKKAATRHSRALNTVILNDGLADELVGDATEFLASGEWYKEVGVPYRRGYLFYGKPGCGKTSFVSALAGRLKLNVCVLTLSANWLNDTLLQNLINQAPLDSIILLEDVDAAFVSREQQQGHRSEAVDSRGRTVQQNSITFSGILNALDGISSQEGRLFVMTTNHPDKLDPALVRPGRIDRSVEFRLASLHQLRRLFVKFFPSATELAHEFADAIGDCTVSMASVQGHLLQHRRDPAAALNQVHTLLQQLQLERQTQQQQQEQQCQETPTRVDNGGAEHFGVRKRRDGRQHDGRAE